MNWKKKIALLGVGLMVFSVSASFAAASAGATATNTTASTTMSEEEAEKEAKEIFDRAMKQAREKQALKEQQEKKKVKKASKSQEENEDNAKKDEKKKKVDPEEKRFVELLKDNGFTYYLDTKNARWIRMPHSGNEYIADVWVKLVQTDENAEYSYPPKYFLAHYYVRPNTQQIQFLSELEVTGRPDNAIKERPYSMQNWENLVPGSVEDELYHGIVKNMKKNRLGGKSSNGMSVRDMVEEYLRISL